VTLTGIATVSFASTNPTNSGTLKYQWYEIGVGPVSDGNGVTGSATTTLSLQSLVSPTDSGRDFYLEASYEPSTETGSGINEPFNSNTVTVTIFPFIEIIAQPSNSTTIPNRNTTFNIDASLSDATFAESLTYQWTLNGNDAVDGTTTQEIPVTRFEETFSSDTTVTLPSDALDIEIEVAGGSGGGGGGDAGGSLVVEAGGRYGKFSYNGAGTTLDLKVGRSGNGGTSGNAGAYGTGGASGVAWLVVEVVVLDLVVGLVVEAEAVVPLVFMIEIVVHILSCLAAVEEAVVPHIMHQHLVADLVVVLSLLVVHFLSLVVLKDKLQVVMAAVEEAEAVAPLVPAVVVQVKITPVVAAEDLVEVPSLTTLELLHY
jgi:hypothetical protein